MLDAYAGVYSGPMYGDAEVKLENGKLVIRLLPTQELVGDLTHWQFDTFRIVWRRQFPFFGSGKAQFVFDERGRVTEMKINVPNRDFWFDELEFRRRP
jgi:hypothetical protein